jgi:hypothetical protein
MMPAMAAHARAILTGGEPAAWRQLGFSVQEDGSARVGEFRLVTGADELRVEATGLSEQRPDGLAIVTAGDAPDVAADPHPNGATGIDHVVALTDDLDRTSAALERAGAPLRRRAEPMAFHRLGPLVLEVVRTGAAPALWGFVVVVPDLDAVPLLGTPRPAVQPGRRIATVRSEAALPVALAFMTPQPRRVSAVGD